MYPRKRNSGVRSIGRRMSVLLRIGLFVLPAALAAHPPETAVNELADPDDGAYDELREKVRSAKQIVPWRIYDSYKEFRGQYVQTFGYLALCSNQMWLFPSREYAKVPLFRYMTGIPEYRNPFNGYVPTAGDYIEIVARVTENDRWQSVDGHQQIFDEIVLINRYAPPYQFCADPKVDDQCSTD